MENEEVIEIKSNVHWYSLYDLLKRYPIKNNRWQLSDSGQSFEYFYDLDEQPETDPWNRKIQPWKRDLYDNPERILHWENSNIKGNYYRGTSVEGKTVMLWMYPSSNHPLFK